MSALQANSASALQVSISGHSGNRQVTIDAPVPGVPQVQIVSSGKGRVLPAKMPGWVTPATQFLLDDRSRNAGHSKGRVLMAFVGNTLVGVCTYHLDSNSTTPVAYEIAARTSLSADHQNTIREALVLVLRSISKALGGTGEELRFADQPLKRAPDQKQAKIWRQEVRGRAGAAGFTEVISPFPKRLKPAWARCRKWKQPL